jgi:hypothetical protein
MSSSGVLTQLAALGPQNIWLNADALITFFKGGYRRYTNFAMGEFDQPFSVGADSLGTQKVVEVDRNGDLLAQCYLYMNIGRFIYNATTVFDLSAGDFAHLTNSFGHAAITDVSVKIGSQEFDKHYGEYLEAWECLAAPPEKRLTEMIGYAETAESLALFGLQAQNFWVPMRFWFNRFYEQALPLIALQHHKVIFTFNTRAITSLVIREGATTTVTAPDPLTPTVSMLCNYVFLDTMERRMFAQNAHEYLIDVLQFTGAESHAAADTTQSFTLAFNHPTKELVWLCRQTTNETAFRWMNFSGPTVNIPGGALLGNNGTLPTDPLATCQLQINGHDRYGVATAQSPAEYFRLVQPYEKHTRVPNRHVYCYSFSLYPEDVKPSGALNLSRIDKVIKRLTYAQTLTLGGQVAVANTWAGNVYIYARSLNVIKVLSGMAGLLYAN